MAGRIFCRLGRGGAATGVSQRRGGSLCRGGGEAVCKAEKLVRGILCRRVRGEAALLEAAVVIPAVTLILCTLFRAGFYLCDRALCARAADKYAALAAEEFLRPGYTEALFLLEEENAAPGPGTVAELTEQRRPYRYIALRDGDFPALSDRMAEEILSRTVLPWDTRLCSVRWETEGRTVRVYAEVEMQSAEGGAAGLLPGLYCLSCDTVSDAGELLRNTDLTAQLVRKIAGAQRLPVYPGSGTAQAWTSEDPILPALPGGTDYPALPGDAGVPALPGGVNLPALSGPADFPALVPAAGQALLPAGGGVLP